MDETIEAAISTIEYTKYDDKPIVHLFGRDKDMNRVHVRVYDLFPFFYVDREEPVPKNDRIRKVVNVSSQGWKSIKGSEVKKVIMKLPEDVGGNRQDKEGIRARFKQTYEDDIEYTLRTSIELGIKSGFRCQKFDNDYNVDPIEAIDFKANLRRLHIDIETSSKESGGKLPSWKNPVNVIYSISCFDTYLDKIISFIFHPDYSNKKFKQKYKVPFDISKFGNKFKPEYEASIYTFNNERDMLQKFIDFVKETDPDIPTGWNFRKFDCPYLIERMKRLGLEVASLSPLRSVYIDSGDFAHIKGRIVFDTWEGYRKTLTSEIESTKLDNVAKKLFNVGKVKHKGIDLMWKSNRNLLLLYNIQDVFLDYAIGEVQGIFNFFYDVKCYSGCSYQDVLNNSRIVDAFMLFKAKEFKIVLPSKRNREQEEKYEGAVVIQAPSRGLKRWLCVLDLKSLYPMIMLTFNMGEDTIVLNPTAEQIPNLISTPLKGVYFRKDKKSFLATILQELIEKRNEYKNKKEESKKAGDKIGIDLYNRLQTVVKFITNSIYGVLGWIQFRLYNKHIASCITAVGRIVITFTIQLCKRKGYEIYYGDTDSIFPFLKNTELSKILTEMKELTTFINKSYSVLLPKYNLDEHKFQIQGEKVFKTLFMVKLKGGERTAKKRYAGHIVWEDEECDKLGIKGFDRSDMSRVGNIIMKKVLEKACYDQPLEDIVGFIKSELHKIRNKEYPLSDIAFSKGISKSLELYGNQDWIRGARWTNRYSGLWGAQTNYGAGSKPKYVYLIPDIIPHTYHTTSEIIALDDNFYLPDHLVNVIDWELLIEKTIKYKIDTILEALGIEWESIGSKIRYKSILSYGKKESDAK